MTKPRHYIAHETARQDVLDGLPLAGFGQRAAGFVVDFLLVVVFYVPLEFAWRRYVRHEQHIHVAFSFEHLGSYMALVIYFALAVYLGRGQTLGKKMMHTRIVSLTHDRVGLWQAIERALGYGASALEFGFGFVQFFLHRNQMCVHDRISETIVVDVRKTATRRPPAVNSES
jgi:uncharacterized RDD family membrane protein YckC